MREILFRGKRVDNGEWAESQYPYGTMSGGVVQHDFISETIGQYTEIADKNGTKIFEGDIIESNVTKFSYVVIWDDAFAAYMMISSQERYGLPQRLYKYGSRAYEVIGNIHDNPELIEDMDIKPAAKMSDTPAEQLGLAPAT